MMDFRLTVHDEQPTTDNHLIAPVPSYSWSAEFDPDGYGTIINTAPLVWGPFPEQVEIEWVGIWIKSKLIAIKQVARQRVNAGAAYVIQSKMLVLDFTLRGSVVQQTL